MSRAREGTPAFTDADHRLMAIGSSDPSSTTETSSTNGFTKKRGKPHGRVWLAVAVGLFGIGSIGSVFGAHAVAHTDAQRSRQAFATSAKDISLLLQKSLQHEQDLSFSASAFVVGNQNASQAGFRNWAAALHAFERYPELLAVAVLVMVPAAQLATFTAREIADPPGALAPNGGIGITPAGARPYYCLESVSDVRDWITGYSGWHRLLQDRIGTTTLEFPRLRKGHLLAVRDGKGLRPRGGYSDLPRRNRPVDRCGPSGSLHRMDGYTDQAKCSPLERIGRSPGHGGGISVRRCFFARHI